MRDVTRLIGLDLVRYQVIVRPDGVVVAHGVRVLVVECVKGCRGPEMLV